MGKDALWATAYHEAGHAVISHFERMRLRSASIVPEGTSKGRVTDNPRIPTWVSEATPTIAVRDRVERNIRTFLAGEVAQRRFNPRSVRRVHGSQDMKYATHLLEAISTSPQPVPGEDVYEYDEEYRLYLRLLKKQTERLVEFHWPYIEVVTRTLFERKELKAREIRELIYQESDRQLKAHYAKGKR